MRADILVHYWSGVLCQNPLKLSLLMPISCTHGSYSKCPLPSWPREKVSQSCGNAARNSESIRDLISVGYFADRGKVGNGQWLRAKVTSQIGKPNAGLPPAAISAP